MELVGERLKCLFGTDAKRECSRGVIGSMIGAYRRGTSSNHVEWTFFSLMP